MPKIYLEYKDKEPVEIGIENLKKILLDKGFVTVDDFYNAIGVYTSNSAFDNYIIGWTNLDTARVYETDDFNTGTYIVVDAPPYEDISQQVRLYYKGIGIEDIKTSIQKVAEAFGNNPIKQTPYVVEEMSELTKELCKIHRHKHDKNKIIEEACDVLNSVAVLLYEMKVSDSEIFKNMIFKLDRALKRKENGEL